MRFPPKSPPKAPVAGEGLRGIGRAQARRGPAAVDVDLAHRRPPDDLAGGRGDEIRGAVAVDVTEVRAPKAKLRVGLWEWGLQGTQEGPGTPAEEVEAAGVAQHADAAVVTVVVAGGDEHVTDAIAVDVPESAKALAEGGAGLRLRGGHLEGLIAGDRGVRGRGRQANARRGDDTDETEGSSAAPVPAAQCPTDLTQAFLSPTTGRPRASRPSRTIARLRSLVQAALARPAR